MSKPELLPDAPECLHKGERKLAPGVWRCAEGHLHIVAPELCRAFGYAVTAENIERLARAVLKTYPDTRVIE